MSRYQSARALQQAVKSVGTSMIANAELNAKEGVTDSFIHDRFLCRIFGFDSENAWVLKGGTNMLARVPQARRTMDIDLYQAAVSLAEAKIELIELARQDLEDFLIFQFSTESQILGGWCSTRGARKPAYI